MNGQSSIRGRSLVSHEALNNYLSTINRLQPPPPEQLASEALEVINRALELANTVLVKGQKYKYFPDLTPDLVATILNYCYPIILISEEGGNRWGRSFLGVYQADGDNWGTYDVTSESLGKLASQYNPGFADTDFRKIEDALKKIVVRRRVCDNPDLIAVNNGIFNYKTKQLQPFDPDLVFLSKSKVNYRPNPVNPVLHNPDDNSDWDVESWMKELSDDPEIVTLLWEILGAVIRPNVPWNKAAWLFSNTGNNGKGTLCELMRNLCGPGTYASISLSEFSQNFQLEPLIGASAIIVDENDVGGFIDKAANLKAVITGDVILLNRKFKTPIAFRFRGLMVQCVNSLPRVQDKSGSFYRRQLIVPFTKCFTGVERKYIKAEYLKRQDVLEYVLHRVLHMDYDALSEPAACRAELADYKEFNDPVRLFCGEMLPRCVWDLVPFSFLYDLYKAWSTLNNPNGRPQGRENFISDVMAVLPDFPNWSCEDRKQKHRPKQMMDSPEPLISEFDLRAWKNPYYTGGDPNKICTPQLSASYTGLLRNTAAQTVDDA